MKKLIALSLVLMLGMTMLDGCGGSNDGNAGNTPPPSGDSGNGNTDSGPGEKVEVGELTILDLGYMTVGYPASAEPEDDWIWGKMIKDKNGRYSFDFASEQNRNNIDVTRDEWVVANQNSTSNFTEFEQEIGGMTDVFCVKYNDVAMGPTAHYSAAFAETVDGVAGVKIRINSKADGMKIDDVLALAEVQAILGSIQFKQNEGNSVDSATDNVKAEVLDREDYTLTLVEGWNSHMNSAAIWN